MVWALVALGVWLLYSSRPSIGIDGSGHVTSFVGQADLGAPAYSPYEAPRVVNGPGVSTPSAGVPISAAGGNAAPPGGLIAAAAPLLKSATGWLAGAGAGAGGAATAGTVTAAGAAPGALGTEALAQPVGAASLPALEAAAIPFAGIAAFRTALLALNPTIGTANPAVAAANRQWLDAYNRYLAANGVNPNYVQATDPTGAIQEAARVYANQQAPAAVSTPTSAPPATYLLTAGDRER